MKASIFLKLTVCFILLLNSCVPKQGYVNIAPRTTAVSNKITKPLTIYLENIPDNLNVTGLSMPQKVTEYRRTLTDALMNAFQNSFTNVSVKESWNGEGYGLKVSMVDPYYVVVDKVLRRSSSDGRTYEENIYACAFQTRARLLENGKEISSIDRKITGPTGKKLFENGLRTAIEELHEAIVITSDLYKKSK